MILNIQKTERKIKKLLALAQSNNAFEAIRATAQANALIKQINGHSTDNLTQTKTEVKIKGRHLYQSDFNILNSICSATGTKQMIIQHNRIQEPVFIGYEKRTKEAALIWDVIQTQLNSRKKELSAFYNDAEIELFAMGFSQSFNTSICNQLGFLKCDNVTTIYAQTLCDQSDQSPINLNSKEKTPLIKALIWTGFRAGENSLIKKTLLNHQK